MVEEPAMLRQPQPMRGIRDAAMVAARTALDNLPMIGGQSAPSRQRNQAATNV
nr:hypothetical protein [Sphingomonas melonis]